MPGVATGLAVTGTGGDVLFVEATTTQGRREARPHRPAGRRDEGVGTDRALGGPGARDGPRLDEDALRGPLVPHPRPGGRDPEGRAERRHRDGDRVRVAPVRPAGQAHGRHDRRGDAAGSRAPDRRAQAEGARRARRRAHRRDHPRAEPRRPRRRAAEGARRDDVPPGDVARRGARGRARAEARAPDVACRPCTPVPEEVRRAAGLLERRWTVSILWASYEGASRFNEFRQAVGGIPPTTLAAAARRARGGRRCSSARSSTPGRRASSTGSPTTASA